MLTAMACMRWLDGKGQRIAVGELLQEVAQKCRQDFIEYIGELSTRYCSDFWWLSSLSEKNPYVSKVFLRSCYVLVAERIVSAAEGTATILFVVEDRVVRKCLAQHLRARVNGQLRWCEPPGSDLVSWLDDTVQFCLRRLWFIVRHLSRILLVRALKVGRETSWSRINRDLQTGAVLIHNWVDRRSFDEEGAYHSINFGDLDQYLIAQGRRYAIVPTILPSLPFRIAVRALVCSGVPFLLPQAYLTPLDIVRTAWKGSVRPSVRKWPLFQGVDISGLILEDQRQDWVLGRYPTNALIRETVRRWRDAGIPIHSFIYTFENQLWEKAYCLAFRTYYPEANLIGYQDAHLPMMVLNFFMARREAFIFPRPDVLITNGRHSFELLAQGGHSPAWLRCGGALRYRHLTMPTLRQEGPQAGRGDSRTHSSVILVTPSISETLACELLWKVLRAFGREPQIRVVLKCHPGLPFSALSARLKVVSLPPHFEVSDRPVGDLLLTASVLVYMDSTTSLEALAMGVPLIHVASEFGLDFDPLDGHPDIRQTAREPGELLDAALMAVGSEIGLAGRAQQGQELVSQFLGPVNESVYGLFLDKKPPLPTALPRCNVRGEDNFG